ncbi:MAG: NfeD family protein [Holophagaceae bacterium]|jgi:membrane protein implicated in regulation of membrane protease activity|nr:NfeD family protein [Holophagaceae bacterium]
MGALAWLILAVVLLLVEMLTPGIFFFACFSIGAFFTAAVALFGMYAWAEWAVFFVTSLLSIFLIAPIARRWMKRIPETPVGLDSLEGQRAHVLESIDPISGKGQVKLSNGAIWRAVSDQPIDEGTLVKVASVTGTRLKVNPHSETNPSGSI